MFKKLWTVSASLLLVGGLLAGCGSNNNAANNTAGNTGTSNGNANSAK